MTRTKGNIYIMINKFFIFYIKIALNEGRFFFKLEIIQETCEHVYYTRTFFYCNNFDLVESKKNYNSINKYSKNFDQTYFLIRKLFIQ